MINRPHEELTQITLDIHHGRIFTNLHLQVGDTADMVFLPLALLDNEHIQRLRDDPPGLFFEDMSKASDWAVNGYPQFFSVQMLSPDDAFEVIETLQKLQAAEREALVQP